RFAVHLDGDVIADGGHFLGEPFIGFDEHVLHGDKVVQTAGLYRVPMSAIDLGLVAAGKTGTELGAEILAAVAVIIDLRFHAIDEILIIAAFAEEVPGLTAADENAVLHFPFRFVFGMGLPAGQIFSVEKLDKAFVIVGFLVIARRRS